MGFAHWNVPYFFFAPTRGRSSRQKPRGIFSLLPQGGHSHVRARGRGLWRKAPSPLDLHPKHGDATLHRHGNTIPGPNGPPIVPFPRKHLALSAPGGALVLSPLETPPGDGRRGTRPRLWKPTPKGTRDEGRGSGSGKRSRGCPICTPLCAVLQVRGRTDLRFRYSAAGRRVSSLVGSA